MRLNAGRLALLAGATAMAVGLGWWGSASLLTSSGTPADRTGAGPVPPVAPPTPHSVFPSLPTVPTPSWWRPGGKVSVRFDFDDGRLDRARSLALQEEPADGGLVTAVRRDSGWAVHFPANCDNPPEKCPKAILRTDLAGWLNPDTRPLRWGAAVRMSPTEVSDGANVLQKGHSLTGSQFKLQVDGRAGRPTCVMAGTLGGSNRIYVARAGRGVADGRWHRLDCERRGRQLWIMVDGLPDGMTAVPSTLSIVNNLPLCIGGKGVAANNDQFHGTLDDVYVDIG